MAATVDQKLLKATKFPPEFSQKVDIKKVNVEVMKKWIAGKISDILGNEDDVVIELCFGLLEGQRYPDIKSLQIQLTGFLDKDTPKFCKELWNLCLSAQTNPQGVPKELLEAKKLELIQEKIDAEKAADEARKRQETERTRERDVNDIRQRERADRGRGAAAGEVVALIHGDPDRGRLNHIVETRGRLHDGEEIHHRGVHRRVATETCLRLTVAHLPDQDHHRGDDGRLVGCLGLPHQTRIGHRRPGENVGGRHHVRDHRALPAEVPVEVGVEIGTGIGDDEDLFQDTSQLLRGGKEARGVLRTWQCGPDIYEAKTTLDYCFDRSFPLNSFPATSSGRRFFPSLHADNSSHVLNNRPRWDMYASLRGVSSSEDSAKLNRRITWAWPLKPVTASSNPDSDYNLPLPIELPTPLADRFIIKSDLVPPSLRPQIKTAKKQTSTRSAKTPITIRGKRSSVSDLVGKFEIKDSRSEPISSPLHRAATAPSPRLRTVYLSTLPGPSARPQSYSQPPPRRRLVSRETSNEEGCPFTQEQVSAAKSFTTPKARQSAVSELPGTSAVKILPLHRDTAVQARSEYQDRTTQVAPAYKEAVVQSEVFSLQTAVKASPTCQDQTTQFPVEFNHRAIQAVTQHTDQSTQLASADKHCNQWTVKHSQECSKAKRKGAFRDQASQRDYDTQSAKRSSAQEENDVSGRVVPKVESVGELGQITQTQQSATLTQPESQSSTESAFFTARNCSGISQPPDGNNPPTADILLAPNAITVEFPEGTRVRMLQTICGGKIVIEPSPIPRATSSEALAEGELYTSGYVREEESKPAQKRSPTASCSSFNSESSCFSVRPETTSAPKAASPETSGTVEDSQYTEARQHLTSQTHDSARESVSRPEAPSNSEATQADQTISQAASLPDLPNSADSNAQAPRRASFNVKRRASSFTYWFELEDKNPRPELTSSLVRPQILSETRSVPVIRVQRPSTDSEMVFGLGTRAVKPSISNSPLVPAIAAPVEEVGDIAPDVTLPTTAAVEKKHLRERLRNQRSRQPISIDTAAGKVGIRARVKRKGSNVGRKGRKKLVFRKKVLRVLLGKELAEKVSQILNTADGVMGTVGGVVEPVPIVASDIGTPLQEAASNAPKAPVSVTKSPLIITTLAPAQMDGSVGRSSIVPGYLSPDTSVTSADTDVYLAISAFDGSHEERKAKRRAKKDQKRKDYYEQLKTNLEALTSTPCDKCGGQPPYILKFAYEYKKKMIKHERPWSKRRDRKKEAKTYTKGLKCRCPKSSTASGPTRPSQAGDGGAAMAGAAAASSCGVDGGGARSGGGC